jgi:AcrR family transcriptional regulator
LSDEKTARRQSSVKAERRADMIEQILDTAELLFSRNGLHGVTLKDVAKRIGVHHTLINYYFEDKKTLFDAVFARRAVITSERRMRLLDEYDRATAGKPSVEGALRVFLDSDLDLYIEGGEGWRNYGALGAQVANTPEWGAEMMDQHFDPVVLRLIDLLKKALPGCANPATTAPSRSGWRPSWPRGFWVSASVEKPSGWPERALPEGKSCEYGIHSLES